MKKKGTHAVVSGLSGELFRAQSDGAAKAEVIAKALGELVNETGIEAIAARCEITPRALQAALKKGGNMPLVVMMRLCTALKLNVQVNPPPMTLEEMRAHDRTIGGTASRDDLLASAKLMTQKLRKMPCLTMNDEFLNQLKVNRVKPPHEAYTTEFNLTWQKSDALALSRVVFDLPDKWLDATDDVAMGLIEEIRTLRGAVNPRLKEEAENKLKARLADIRAPLASKDVFAARKYCLDAWLAYACFKAFEDEPEGQYSGLLYRVGLHLMAKIGRVQETNQRFATFQKITTANPDEQIKFALLINSGAKTSEAAKAVGIDRRTGDHIRKKMNQRKKRLGIVADH